MRVILFVMATLWAPLGVCFAEDPHAPADAGWPHHRGPSFDGASPQTGLADSWPAEGPPVLWMREIGRGYSGLIAVGQRVYTQGQTHYAQYVYCLDAETGETIWRHRYGWPYDAAGIYPGPRATPTYSGGRIYFAGANGLIGCLDAGSGELVWSVNVVEKFAGQGTGFGYSCSPLVIDGKVILPVGGRGAGVVALEADSGAVVWRSGNDPASYCSALPAMLDGKPAVIALLQNSLAMFAAESGEMLWRKELSHGYDEHSAYPLYSEGRLMIASPFKAGADLLRIERAPMVEENSPASAAATPYTVKTEWFNPKLSNDTASSILLGGHVYGFDLRDVQSKAHRPSRGEFRCVDFASGEILWSTGNTGHATVIAADGKLVLFNDKGEVILARASHERYEELARAAVFGGEICWTAPALADGRLYLRSPTRAACLYLGAAEQLPQSQHAELLTTADLPQALPVGFFASLIGGEREYAFDPPDAPELWRWYGWSLAAVLGIAAAMALATYGFLRGWGAERATRVSRIVFWTAALLLGIVGTPILNRATGSFVFTWPAALCVVFQVVFSLTLWAEKRQHKRRSRWLARGSYVLFALACLAYFHLCRVLSLTVLWAFLIGFSLAWPVALLAAWRMLRAGHPLYDLFWAAVCFTAYFWACGGYILGMMRV